MKRNLKRKKYTYIIDRENKSFYLMVNENSVDYKILFDLDCMDKVRYVLATHNICISMNRVYVYNEKKKYVLAKEIFGISSMIYMKNENTLDLRWQNITTNRRDVDQFTERCKENYQKQDKSYFFQQMRKKRYTKEYSTKLSRAKASENNTMVKLNYDIIKEIREAYEMQLLSQQELAKQYQVGRATIADIVNYRTWAMKEDSTIRQFKSCKPISKLKYGETLYDRIPDKESYLEIDDYLIYFEKLPIERLLYIEVRTGGNFLLSMDLYFPEGKRRGLKNEFIVSSVTPHKVNKSEASMLLDRIYSYFRIGYIK